MNALDATLITIGGFVALVVIIAVVGHTLSGLDRDRIRDVGCIILFFYLPIPLMIYGVATGNIGLIILAEAAVFIVSMLAYSVGGQGLHNLILIIPTAICLIYCIVLNQVVEAVIVTILGLPQLGIAFDH